MKEERRKQNYITPASSTSIVEQGTLPDGTTFALTSGGLNQGDTASIMLGDTDYSQGLRGINIVVYDNSWHKVVASTVFDTCAQAHRSIG